MVSTVTDIVKPFKPATSHTHSYSNYATIFFSGKNMLIDLESNERRVGGGDLGLMQWRVEGSHDDLPPLLPVGLR